MLLASMPVFRLRYKKNEGRMLSKENLAQISERGSMAMNGESMTSEADRDAEAQARIKDLLFCFVYVLRWFSCGAGENGCHHDPCIG